MDLIDLKKEPEQAYSEGEMYEDQPAYSYGLCISLGEEELAKLGIEELPAAGAEMMIKAMAYVKTASEKKEMDGTSKHLELQICAMGIDPIDPRQGFGSLAILQPFLAQLASITNA